MVATPEWVEDKAWVFRTWDSVAWEAAVWVVWAAEVAWVVATSAWASSLVDTWEEWAVAWEAAAEVSVAEDSSL